MNQELLDCQLTLDNVLRRLQRIDDSLLRLSDEVYMLRQRIYVLEARSIDTEDTR